MTDAGDGIMPMIATPPRGGAADRGRGRARRAPRRLLAGGETDAPRGGRRGTTSVSARRAAEERRAARTSQQDRLEAGGEPGPAAGGLAAGVTTGAAAGGADDLRGEVDAADTMRAEDSSSEVDLTQSPASAVAGGARAHARVGRGGRAPVADGIDRPNTSALSPESAAAAMKAYKKEKSKAASQRFRERAKEAEKLLDEDECTIVYRKLAEMHIEGDAVASFRRGLEEGSTYSTKDLLKHRIREAAEYLGIYDLVFESNSSSKVEAFSKGIVAKESFKIIARAKTTAARQEWVIRTSVCTNGVFDRQSQRPGPGQPKTAYRERDVAVMLQAALEAEPHLSGSACRSLLKPFLRFSETLTDNMVSRSRTMALQNVYGQGILNIKMLPALKAEMESHGHSLSFTTFGGAEMRQIILSVAKAEYVRAANEARKVPPGQRTVGQEEALRPWNTHGKPDFLSSREELLEEVEEPGKEYVECIVVSFSHTSEGREKKLLRLINADAAHGKLLLDMYNIFCVVGFTSNMEIVPLLYVFITGNESKSTWTRVMQEIKERYPGIGSDITITTDQDKGATGAVSDVFSLENLVHLICHHHRLRNLARHGRRVTEAFKKLAYLPTLAKVNALRASTFWTALPISGRDAISSVADDRQFLGVAAERGAVTYGKSSSQAVESQNAHIVKARCLDVFSAVLELCRLEKVRYDARYTKAHGYTGLVSPWAREKLDKLTHLAGTCEMLTVAGQEGSGTDSIPGMTTYRFIRNSAAGSGLRQSSQVGGSVGEERTFTVKLVDFVPASDDDDDPFADFDDCDDDASGGSMFETAPGVAPKLTASCTCGEPVRDRFPCSHMFTVAVSQLVPVERLVPPEFLVSTWRSQFPATSLHFTVPTREDVLARHRSHACPHAVSSAESAEAGEAGSGISLLTPVTAPPKRGRPNLRRRRSAIEKVTQRVRQSQT